MSDRLKEQGEKKGKKTAVPSPYDRAGPSFFGRHRAALYILGAVFLLIMVCFAAQGIVNFSQHVQQKSTALKPPRKPPVKTEAPAEDPAAPQEVREGFPAKTALDPHTAARLLNLAQSKDWAEIAASLSGLPPQQVEELMNQARRFYNLSGESRALAPEQLNQFFFLNKDKIGPDESGGQPEEAPAEETFKKGEIRLYHDGVYCNY